MAHPDTPPTPAWGVTRAIAMRTPFFWVLTAGVASIWMLVTGINFHQISLLTARGLSTAEAAANFIPQTVAALVATFATGYLTDRLRAKYLIAASMTGLLAALALGTVVTAISVGASAFGPLLFATLYQASGSYTPALLAALVLPAAVIIAAVITAPPTCEHAMGA